MCHIIIEEFFSRVFLVLIYLLGLPPRDKMLLNRTRRRTCFHNPKEGKYLFNLVNDLREL